MIYARSKFVLLRVKALYFVNLVISNYSFMSRERDR